jgi:hypothetical protein
VGTRMMPTRDLMFVALVVLGFVVAVTHGL